MDQEQIMETLAKILQSQNNQEKYQELISNKLDELISKQELLSKEFSKLNEIIDSTKRIVIKESLKVVKEQNEQVEPLITYRKKPTHLN